MGETGNSGVVKNMGKDAEDVVRRSKSMLVYRVVLIFMWFQPVDSHWARITRILERWVATQAVLSAI